MDSVLIHNLTVDEIKTIVREAVRAEMAAIIPQEPVKKYVTRYQVRDKYHISLPTIDAYADKGILKKRRIGGRVLFDEAELIEQFN
jgi:hypothetical protein